MKILLAILFAFTSLRVLSQPAPLFFEKVQEADGLSHNKVNCMLRDARGFMWIGTDDGLNRYDGHNFTVFRHIPNDSTTVSGNIVTGLHEDRDGILWITTSDGGLCSYDYRQRPNRQFRQYKRRAGRKGSIPVNIINDLHEDSNGNIWLATGGHSVMRFNKKSKSFDRPGPPGNKTILDLCEDGNGFIWAGGEGGGIIKIDPRNLQFHQDERYLDLYAKLPHAAVTAIFRDSRNNMWFGSWDEVLYKYDPNTKKEDLFKAAGPMSFVNDEIHCFAEDAKGRIWMGGISKGLQVYDPATGKFLQYRYDPSREGTISDNSINCIFIEPSGRIWVGTNRGLSISNPQRQQFRQHFLTSSHSGEKQIRIYDFFEVDNKNIWIGTSEGIYVRSPDGSLQHHPLSYKGTPLHVTSFFRDGNTYYLGTNYSLFIYDPVSHRLTLLPGTEQDQVMNKIIDSRIVSIVKDTLEGKPVLIVLPYGHFLAWYDLNDKKWVSRLDTNANILQRYRIRDNLIRKLLRTRDGILWTANGKNGLGMISDTGMVYFYNRPGEKGGISGNNVFDMVEDDKGNLWVSTYGGGLNYFDTKTRKFTQVPASNNLIEGLDLDERGNVWMVSNGYLHMYDPKSRFYSSFLLPDLEKTGGVNGSLFRCSSGRVYVAGINYYISFHPDSIRTEPSRPLPVFTGFTIFNQSQSHLLYKEEISLSYRKNYFTIEYAAPDFSNSRSLIYAYKLEGFDDDWVESPWNRVSYSNLEGGEYEFKVKATNMPGVWSEEYASIKIVIIPPIWKRPWFYVLMVLVAAGAVYAIYRYRINELLKRQAIRNRIAQDLHDNVGSTLSSISVYGQVAKIYHDRHQESELKQTLEKISDTSSEMISEMNDIVWAINPRNDNMQVILQRMESFARPLLASKNVRFDFRYDPAVVGLNLDMQKRKNFYLVFKEAVNNAMKYSQCNMLKVDIGIAHSRMLRLSIEDDGIGFDPSTTSEGYKSSDAFGGGNGLKNMQLRAREMKGSLKFESAPGKGTRIILEFPFT